MNLPYQLHLRLERLKLAVSERLIRRRPIYITKSGRVITDDDIERWAEEAERGYDPTKMRRIDTQDDDNFAELTDEQWARRWAAGLDRARKLQQAADQHRTSHPDPDLDLDPDTVVTGTGQIVHIHPATKCTPWPCPYHGPSPHHMTDWPTSQRTDAMKHPLVERICEHSIGHPDPDSLRYLMDTSGDESWAVHGCDGCCTPPPDDAVPALAT